MDSNRIIIGSGIVTALVVSLNAIQHDNWTYRILIGSGALILLLAMLAAIGEGPGKIASAFAVLVATTAVMYEATDFFGLIERLGGSNEPS